MDAKIINDENSSSIDINSIMSLIDQNKYAAARDLANQIYERNTSSFKLNTILSIVNYYLKDYDKSRLYCDISIQINPSNSDLYNLLASIDEKQGKIGEAENHYKISLKLNKNNANTHYNLAKLYDVYHQDLDKALIHYEQYLAITNNIDKNTQDWVNQIKTILAKS